MTLRRKPHAQSPGSSESKEKYPQNPHGWCQYRCLGANYQWYVTSGLQDCPRALFEAAADVERELGKNSAEHSSDSLTGNQSKVITTDTTSVSPRL